MQWWEYFRVRDLAEDEFIDDSSTIGGLGPETKGERVKKSWLYEYSFPEQEVRIKIDDSVECPITQQRVGTVVDIRQSDGVIVVKRMNDLPLPRRALVAENSAPPDAPLQAALAEIAEALTPDFGLTPRC